MACIQPPVARNGNGNANGHRPGLAGAFWETGPERKLQHLADLAKNKLWIDIVFYARENPEIARSAIARLVRARKELIRHEEVERVRGYETQSTTERVYCRDADRVLAFMAEESPYPAIGKRAVADIVMMGDEIGGERVFKNELLSGIATRGKSYEVVKYALDQMAMLGMRAEIKELAEAFVGLSDMRTRNYALGLIERMDSHEIEAGWHGC